MADEINRLSKERSKIPTSKMSFADKEKAILDIDRNIKDGL